ncbi:hypothetical protein [Blastococcus sp. TBT05-19]|uniref:hypothetical protein n=1 Tax=Blastococcus sp. TBT05-19 TaxID=2250581 RepID=UPI0011BFC475|nr:hypothetical protein [Blastococcus sp. TBT05-19]
MDVPIAGSAAWLVLGTVLGVLLAAAVVAAVLAARRRPPPPPADTPAGPRVDDLADFLEHPPGTRPAEPATGSWAALAPPPPPPAPGPARTADERGLRPLAVLALAALVLVGLAAAVAVGSRAPDRDTAARPSASEPAPTPPAGGTEGRLTGGGLVLEQRAVGITVTYPELRLATDGGTGRLELRLPTWNCLAAAPPEDPGAAGCVPSLVEHAELTSPELVVERDGDRLLVRGPAATELRPAGTAPEPTGRVYDVELALTDVDGEASGQVRIGTGTAPVSGELSAG